MLYKLLGGFVLVIGFVAIAAILCALPTMLLWNWLMPDIFHLDTITFWQALGLNFLCGILFKSSVSSSKDK